MKAIYVSPLVEIIEVTNFQAVMENSGEITGGQVWGNEATTAIEDEEEEDENDNDLWNKDLSLNWDLWD